MFLKNLSQPEHKQLFMVLAYALCMASGDEDTSFFAQKDEEEFDEISVAQQLRMGVSHEEFHMLSVYLLELFDISPSGSFVEPEFDDDIFWDSFTIVPGFVSNFRRYDLPPFLVSLWSGFEEVLNKVAEQVLEKYKNNADVMQAVLQKASSFKGGMFDMTPEKLVSVAVMLPEIRVRILTEAIRKVVDQYDRKSLTAKDEKILMFELIGVAYSSGAFEEDERKLLENICFEFEFEEDYIDEFSDVVERTLAVYREANDLINE